MSLLAALRERDVTPDLFIVTPFVVVKDGLRRTILESRILSGWISDPGQWVLDRVGTVHTVQGREAEAVIFVLGAPLAQQRGARSWAGGQPNLLNVAITRAQERLYVIGNRRVWREAGVFAELDRWLEPSINREDEIAEQSLNGNERLRNHLARESFILDLRKRSGRS